MSDTESTEEIMPVEQAPIAPIQAQAGFLGDIVRCVQNEGYWSSQPILSHEDTIRLYKATNASEPLSGFGETVIAITDILFATSEITPEGKDMPETVLAVFLIDGAGNSYVSASQGIIKSAAKILVMVGMPEVWEQPIKVVVKSQDTSKGRRYKYLDIV